MKIIKLIKDKELAIYKERSIYCDFCGEENKDCFTSSFDDRKDEDERKCVMQICEDCVKGLSKFLKR